MLIGCLLCLRRCFAMSTRLILSVPHEWGEEAQEDEMTILGLLQERKQSQNLNLCRWSLVPHDGMREAALLNTWNCTPFLCVSPRRIRNFVLFFTGFPASSLASDSLSIWRWPWSSDSPASPPKGWNYKHALPLPVHVVAEIQPRVSRELAFYQLSSITSQDPELLL